MSSGLVSALLINRRPQVKNNNFKSVLNSQGLLASWNEFINSKADLCDKLVLSHVKRSDILKEQYVMIGIHSGSLIKKSSI